MDLLLGDETIFRNPEVFDYDYLPDHILYRDLQLNSLVMATKPAVKGDKPEDCLCLGPPSTGKTTVVKLLLKELRENGVISVYVNCQLVTSKQQVFAKIYKELFGHEPAPFGVPFVRLFDKVFERLVEEDRSLVVALDDLNSIKDSSTISETLYALLKAYEEVPGVKIGIIGVATDIKLYARLDPRVASIFHPHEIFFPPYDRSEVEGILKRRVEAGFWPGVVTEEAFRMIVDLTYEAKDLRLGLRLLKLAGFAAEKRASRKIEVEDVEKVRKSSFIAFVEKALRTLGKRERELLKLACAQEKVLAMDIYKKLRKRWKIGYTKFCELVDRLERLRLVDTFYSKGNKKYIVLKVDPDVLLEYLESKI